MIIPIVLNHSLAQDKWIGLVFLDSQIIWTFPLNKFSFEANGPENSVPAIGWVAKNWDLLGWLETALQILTFVDPKSTTRVFELTKSRISGSCFEISLTGTVTKITSKSL